MGVPPRARAATAVAALHALQPPLHGVLHTPAAGGSPHQPRRLSSSRLKVLIVAEYYPRTADPVRGIWAHRQALAAQKAGAQIRVLVLYRPLPPLAAVRRLDLSAAIEAVRQPSRTTLDGIPIDFVRYVSPPRPWSYGTWGRWAAPALRRALRSVHGEFPFDLVHAHYAVPAGDAVRRAVPDAPLVVSVHGHDVYGLLEGHPAVRQTLAHARLVLANSAGTARRCSDRGARKTTVVHLGADVPGERGPRPPTATPRPAPPRPRPRPRPRW